MKKILTVFVLCLTVFVPVFAANIDDSVRLLVPKKLLAEACKEIERTEALLKALLGEKILTANDEKIIREIAFSDDFGFFAERYGYREVFEDNIIFLRMLNDKLSYALNYYWKKLEIVDFPVYEVKPVPIHEKEIELQVQPAFDHGSVKVPIVNFRLTQPWE